MGTTTVKTAAFVSLVLLGFGIPDVFAQSYDVAWKFGSAGSSSYRLDGFEPADADFGEIGSLDPTLPLELGKRYQVKVASYIVHPFEIIAKASSPGQDVVLLSMTIAGTFESDPEVGWEDNGKGTVTFTLTSALYQAMVDGGRVPGYRCRIHLFEMRGDFTVAGLPIAERIPVSPIAVDLQVVASGLTSPVAMVPDPAGSDRLYIVDQAGLVRVIDNGLLLDDPFLDVRDMLVQPLGILGSFDVNDFDERGFLGLAFHPDFAEPGLAGYGLLYTYTSEPVDGPADYTIDLPPDQLNHQSVIREWQLDQTTGVVDPASSRVVLRVDQPQFNHNAGHVAFGPDGYLYIALGDGGGANDTSAGHGPNGNGQNINTVHGSILRIDPLDPVKTPGSLDAAGANAAYRIPVDNPFVGTDGADEIYAYGLRNPYRFSFDGRSGQLIVADVGQGLVEELNIVRKAGNYGWNIKEGDFLFDPERLLVGLPFEDPALIDPVAQYDHDDGLSVIGGYTYYGSGVPELWGQYVFGDFSRGFRSADGRLLVADLFSGKIEELLIGTAGDSLGLYVKGIGQNRDGEVYVLASTALGPYGDTGLVLKVVPARVQFTAELSGAGAGTNSTATGTALLSWTSGSDTISYQLKVKGIQNVTMAHIHIAAAPGGDGPPAVWLYPAAPPAALIAGEFTGLLAEGEITAANFVGPLSGMTLADLLTAIREDRAYVNIHTQESPGGDIRGLLEPPHVEQPISAELFAGPAGVDSDAIGRAVFRRSPDDGSVSYELKLLNIENVTMAHIHVADTPGGNGAPAVWLYPSAPPASLVPGEFRGLLAEGVFTASELVGPLAGMTLDDLMVAIAEDRAYVNVHTEQFPAGEIRGQLR